MSRSAASGKDLRPLLWKVTEAYQARGAPRRALGFYSYLIQSVGEYIGPDVYATSFFKGYISLLESLGAEAVSKLEKWEGHGAGRPPPSAVDLAYTTRLVNRALGIE